MPQVVVVNEVEHSLHLRIENALRKYIYTEELPPDAMEKLVDEVHACLVALDVNRKLVLEAKRDAARKKG